MWDVLQTFCYRLLCILKYNSINNRYEINTENVAIEFFAIFMHKKINTEIEKNANQLNNYTPSRIDSMKRDYARWINRNECSEQWKVTTALLFWRESDNSTQADWLSVLVVSFEHVHSVNYMSCWSLYNVCHRSVRSSEFCAGKHMSELLSLFNQWTFNWRRVDRYV